jgi:Mor family transcriptional regulator
VSDPLMEQDLFDDLKNRKGVMELKNPELPEVPQIDEADSDWRDDFEQLEDLIGAEAAWKIAEVFAGSTIYIPKSILTNKNYFDIRRKYKSGSSYRELAVEFGYTETHIRNIIHKNKTESKEEIK